MYSVGSVLHDVACLVGVPDSVCLDTELSVRLSRIGPEDVKDKFVLAGGDFLHHLYRSLDLANIIDGSHIGTYSTVDAQDLLFDDSREWEPLEEPVDTLEYRVGVLWVLLALLLALLHEPEVSIDANVLVVASDEMDLIGVCHFEGKQQ